MKASELTKPFDKKLIKVLRKGGKPLKYVQGQHYISKLNDAFGVDGWRLKVLERWREENSIIVRVAIILASDGDAQPIFREAFGGAVVRKGMDLADCYKTAQTDAMKKCASLFGVGRDLYSEDEYQDGVEDVPQDAADDKPDAAVSGHQRKALTNLADNEKLPERWRQRARTLAKSGTPDQAAKAIEAMLAKLEEIDQQRENFIAP